MPRVAYKPKFLEAQRQLASAQSSLAAVRAELARIKGVLAEEGEGLIHHEAEQQSGGSGDLWFNSVEFECVTAYMESQDWMGHPGPTEGYTSMWWRGRRLRAYE